MLVCKTELLSITIWLHVASGRMWPAGPQSHHAALREAQIELSSHPLKEGWA
jgi:hypothetical protein